MSVTIECRAGELLAHLAGELDHHTAAGIRAAVDEAAQTACKPMLRLDFAGVTFMDSAGVGLIMGRYRLMRSLGGRLIVCGAGERIQAMMRMAGLDRLDIWEKGEKIHASQGKK